MDSATDQPVQAVADFPIAGGKICQQKPLHTHHEAGNLTEVIFNTIKRDYNIITSGINIMSV